MSWDAHFDGREWNYTNNVAPMIYAVLEDAGIELEPVTLARPYRETWWDRLNGMTGREGAAYLGQIIDGLERDPERFRAMNPANMRGDYDTLLDTLRAMKRAGDAACCDVRRWSTSG